MKQYNNNLELDKSISSRTLFQMKINDLEEENKALKEEIKRLIGGANMMNDNINNTLHNLIEVYNKCVTHHKEINKKYGKDK